MGALDWENERYVRVYTRDTTAMLMMEWDELNLFWGLLRKVDRAGVLDLEGHGAGALVAHLRCPLAVAERALQTWLKAKWVELHGHMLVIPCHLEAQEARQSDAQRQRNCREQRRAKARFTELTGQSVTMGDESEEVTSSDDTPANHHQHVTSSDTRSPVAASESRPVTRSRAVSHDVTPAQPSLAEPSLAQPTVADEDRAPARATHINPQEEIPCELCEGSGRILAGRKMGQPCRLCAGEGRHLAGGVDPTTIMLAKLLAKHAPEINPGFSAERMLDRWTDRHTAKMAAEAFSKAAVEVGEDWAEERVLRLFAKFLQYAPSYQERQQDRDHDDRGRRTERAHVRDKSPEERRRRAGGGGGARRREERKQAEQKLMNAADGAKMALAAMQAAQAAKGREDRLRNPPIAEELEGPPTPQPKDQDGQDVRPTTDSGNDGTDRAHEGDTGDRGSDPQVETRDLGGGEREREDRAAPPQEGGESQRPTADPDGPQTELEDPHVSQVRPPNIPEDARGRQDPDRGDVGTRGHDGNGDHPLPDGGRASAPRDRRSSGGR